MKNDLKVALIHDFLVQDGGAEQVLRAFHQIFPKAPVYTTILSPEMAKKFAAPEWGVRTAPISHIPLISLIFKYFTLFWPLYFENLDLSNYEVIISDTANFAKGVITRPNQLHISYIHTPPRFLYGYETETTKRDSWFWRPILRVVDNYLRIWDYAAAQRPNVLLTNSQNTAKRIKKFYGRESIVIYPPITIQNPPVETPQVDPLGLHATSLHKNGNAINNTTSVGEIITPYFLVAARLVRYKNLDLAIIACNKLELNLVVVGGGPEEGRLRKMAGPTIKFAGRVSNSELAALYNNCQAFLVTTANEDFGMTTVEALGHGKPVVALKNGGSSEIIEAGISGIFFEAATSEALEEVLKDFNPSRFDPAKCRDRAAYFTKNDFKESVLNIVSNNLTKSASK